MTAYLRINDVEIVSVGMNWKTAGGEITFTREHLADAVAAQDDPLIQRPRIKLGHTDPRFNDQEGNHDPFYDGEPAFGQIENMRLVNDGAMIIGDFVNVPAWLAEAAASAYPNRSMEGAYIDGVGWKVETPGGKTYSMVITAVSLLGIFLPAVEDLEDLQAVLARGEGITIDQGVIAAAGIEAVAGSTAPSAVASIDKVVEEFCTEYCVGEHYYWWPRELLTDPNAIIADDNKGGLQRVPFTSTDDQEVEFGDPTPVLQEFREVPAATRSRILAEATGSRSLARYEERCDHAILASREPQPINAASVSDADWDGSASRFTDQEYARSCVLDRAKCGDQWKNKSSKERYSLPVREPDGTLNRKAVHAAAQRLSGTKACDAAKMAAAKKLVSLYKNDLNETPPDSLTEAAKASKGGVQGSGTTQPMDHGEQLRDLLGLDAEATEEQITEAITAAKEKLEAPAPEPVAASKAEIPEGMSLVDDATLEELRRNSTEGAEARKEQIKAERGRIVEAAIKAGKIPPARRDHYLSLFESDHDGTKTLLTASKEEGGLAAGVIPVDKEEGSSADPEKSAAAMHRIMGSFGIPAEKVIV